MKYKLITCTVYSVLLDTQLKNSARLKKKKSPVCLFPLVAILSLPIMEWQLEVKLSSLVRLYNINIQTDLKLSIISTKLHF